MTIRMGFSTSKGFISWVIRKITRSKASHAWVTFRDPTLNKTVVMHATRRGFHLEPWSKFVKHSDTKAQFTCTLDLLPGVQYLANWLGTRYDYKSIFGFFWIWVASWFHRKIKNPFRNTAKMVCSEAMAILIQKAGVNRSEKLDPESTTPEALWEFMGGHEQFTWVESSFYHKTASRRPHAS
jgi:hypothetical protein